jgi:hypothetical protein
VLVDVLSKTIYTFLPAPDEEVFLKLVFEVEREEEIDAVSLVAFLLPIASYCPPGKL